MVGFYICTGLFAFEFYKFRKHQANTGIVMAKKDDSGAKVHLLICISRVFLDKLSNCCAYVRRVLFSSCSDDDGLYP
jgi:hypothetical protein